MKKAGLYLYIVFLAVFSLKAQESYDSLLSLLKKSRDDAGKVDLLYQLSDLSMDNKNVLKFAEQSLKLAEKLNYKKGIANACNNIGFVYSAYGELDKAMAYDTRALKIRQEINDIDGIAVSYNELGSIYDNQGQIEKALDYYLNVLNLQDSLKNKQTLAVAVNNIGLIYERLKQHEKAIEFNRLSFKLYKEVNDIEGVATALNNLGLIYDEKKDFENSLVCYRRSIQIRDSIGNKDGVAISLNNIAFVLHHQNEDKKALEMFEKSRLLNIELNDKRGQVSAMVNCASILLKLGKDKESEKYCTEAMAIARQIGYPASIKESANILYQVYKKSGRYEKSTLMLQLFKNMSDSISNVQTREASIKKQMQYEFEKKESSIRIEQEKKDLLSGEELRHNRNQRNYFIVGIFLLLFLAIFIFRGYIEKRKINSVITAKMRETNAQKEIIEEKQKEILDSIHYAHRIQKALITSEKYIERRLNELI